MLNQAYEKLIFEGIKGLSQETLREIVKFIYYQRKLELQPQDIQEELQNTLINHDLRILSIQEELHLEKEFEDYDKLYPGE